MTLDPSHVGRRGPCPFCQQLITAGQSNESMHGFSAHRVITAADDSFANDDSWRKRHSSLSRSRSRRKKWEAVANDILSGLTEVRGRLAVAALLLLVAIGLIAFGLIPHR